MARALSLMIASNFDTQEGVWKDVRVSRAALDTFALYGDVGSIGLAKKPRQLRPAGSVALLAQSGAECRD
eukprot:10827327-Alexandrium_andersonii.AAC.1